MNDITRLPLDRISALLSDRSISSVELTKAYLENIENNKHLNAFITVTAEEAVRTATEIDRRRMNGEPLSPLAGVPFAVKDNMCVNGIPTTCGSKMLSDFRPPYTATAVKRILSIGGVLLGKTNMDEFAMGSCSDTSYFGAVLNPLDTLRSPGGSSGGSAAAVAAGLAAYALGSDTGGSVRQPAAFCGVVGMKPTYGAVSRYGLVAFASSLDQIGVLSADIAGNAAVLDCIKGKDNMDVTSLDIDSSFLPDSKHCGKLRIGIAGLSNVSVGVKAAVLCAADILKQMGGEIKEVTLPDSDTLVSAYYIISAAEASSNLARYDGVRYGYRADDADNIDELFVKSRTEGFGDEVKRRIMLGTFCLSEGSKDKYYQKATAARERISKELDRIFEDCDVILSPVAPTTAPLVSEKSPTPLEVYRQDAFTVAANLSGLPALSVPIPMGENEMPSAIQLTGARLSESLLYTVGRIIESEVAK